MLARLITGLCGVVVNRDSARVFIHEGSTWLTGLTGCAACVRVCGGADAASECSNAESLTRVTTHVNPVNHDQSKHSCGL